MPRTRYQRGTLRAAVPGNGKRPERKLPRGTFWGRWSQWVRQPDGSERRRDREKIITKELARKHGIAIEYEGPLSKGDAQRVLERLIAEDTGGYVAPNREATLAEVAQEYLALAMPNWGPHMVRTAGNLVEKHLIRGRLGDRPIASVEESELQAWLNVYVSAGASRSLLSNLLLHTRAVFKHARKKKIMTENPTEDLRAKSKKRVCERTLSLDECRRLLSVVSGRDHLIMRILIQLGLRPEEVFALRHNDVVGDQLRIDEAIVEGQSAPTKTDASHDFVYIPPDLQDELKHWLDCTEGESSDWLFRPTKGRDRTGPLNPNNYRERILQRAAIRAKVGIIDTGKREPDGTPILKTDVDFRALRRTCATLFGDRAKDPKSTQKQLRHADARITLKHYQKAVPESVKAAAIAFESDLIPEGSADLRGSEIQ
jgi:integrase